jgi:hypothetical protein
VVVLVKPPDVPMRVTEAAPVVAALVTVSVNVLVAVAGLGLNEAVTPLGKPDADKLTLPLKPFCEETVMVLAALPPCVVVTLLGEVERVKFGGGAAFTVREIVAEFVKPPDVPMMRLLRIRSTSRCP